MQAQCVEGHYTISFDAALLLDHIKADIESVFGPSLDEVYNKKSGCHKARWDRAFQPRTRAPHDLYVSCLDRCCVAAVIRC